jgi:hypothetical protein
MKMLFFLWDEDKDPSCHLLLFKSCPLILSPNKRESGGDAKPKKLRLKFYSLTFEIGILLLCPEPRYFGIQT